MAALSVVHTNTLWELRMRIHDRSIMTHHDVAVLCIFGNTGTFRRCVTDWDGSLAVYGDFVLSVRTEADKHARYVQMAGDSDDPRDFTGSEPPHTAAAVAGGVESLVPLTKARTWILHGASGGCVTAVEIARKLLARGHRILGLLADSGVPGSGEPLPATVPVAVWTCAWDTNWFQRNLAQIWRAGGYHVIFDYPFHWAGHAGGVDKKRMRESLEDLLGPEAQFWGW